MGKQAYKTSKADQLSLENLTKAMTSLMEAVALLDVEDGPTALSVEPLMADAASLRTRIAAAIRIAEANEMEPLEALAVRRSELQRPLEVLYAKVPAHSCEEEIGEALEQMVDLLYKELSRRLSPQESERDKIERIERGNHMNQVVLIHLIVEALGQQADLRPVDPFDEATHPVLPLPAEKDLPDSSVFTQPGSEHERSAGSPPG